MDTRVRQWPRTPKANPYQSGIEAVTAQFQASPREMLLALAYNGFLTPTLGESVEELIKMGATHITVPTTMFTPGGSRYEVETPDILDHLRPQYPGVELRYA